METILHDLRYGLRLLLKKPGFTIVTVLALALGIGANSAIFSVVNAVVLRPLPYQDSQKLVAVWGNIHRPGLEKLILSAPEFVDIKSQNTVFEDMAAYSVQGVNLTGVSDPERLRSALVSANLIPLLGVSPIQGRIFLPEEDQVGHDQVAILNYGFWQRRFGGDPGIIGRSLTLDGRSINVVGVMPRTFRFPDNEIDLYTPLVFTAEQLSDNYRGSHWLNVIGRLKPGVSIDQAQTEVLSIAQNMGQQYPRTYRKGFSASVVSLQGEVVGDIRLTLFVLLGAVAFVLLIACANVANLLLARAAARHKEVVVRTALGAARSRLIRQFLTESMLLALLGGGIGLLLAYWGMGLLIALSPPDIPRLQEITLDSRVVIFTLLVALITGVLFGLAPALQASKADLNEVLKEGSRGSTEGGSQQRLRSLLVVLGYALSVVLLIGAGLMIKSFMQLRQTTPGFNVDNILTMRVMLPRSKYNDFYKQTSFFKQALEGIGARPGVAAVGAISVLPLSGTTNDRSFRIEDRPVVAGEPLPDEELRMVSPDYFQTMGIALLKGRLFTDHDSVDAPRVAIINEALAERYWSEQNPLGKRLAFAGLSDNKPEWIEVVGVVKNIRHEGLDVEAKPEVYLPYQQPLFAPADTSLPSMYLVIRAAGDPKFLVHTASAEILGLDHDQPVTSIKTMTERLQESIAQRRFNMLMLTLFAGVALALAAVGIYGIMSYYVSQRTHEIGIRMALGAQAKDVLMLVVSQGMVLAVVGLGVGLLAAFAMTRIITSLLYGVSATDPLIFLAISALLGFVALLACFIPARKATKVDPMIAVSFFFMMR